MNVCFEFGDFSVQEGMFRVLNSKGRVIMCENFQVFEARSALAIG